jgi:hypothetical protein
VRVTHKLVNVVWATALTGGSAVVGRLAGPAVALLAALALAGGAVLLAHHVTRRATATAPLTAGACAAVTRWVAGAAALNVAWVAATVVRPDLLAAWLLALVGLAVAEHQAARGLHYLLTRPPTPATGTPTPVAALTPPRETPLNLTRVALVEARGHFSHALDRAKLGWLRVTDVAEIPSGWQFEVLVTSAAQEGKSGTAKTLGPANAEALAIALSEVLGLRLRTDWVQVVDTGYAGGYRVSVVTTDRRAVVIPYVDDPRPTSITVPCPIGYRLDGTVVAERLDQHGQTIGKTRWGKSCLAHVKAAHLTRCVDAEWWVCGTEKLYDLLAGWLAPYEAHARKSPVDYVAYGLADTLELLVGALRLARYRQRVPLALRRPWHKVVITLDEASFALENTSAKVEYDGKRRTAAELVAMLEKGGGSAGVHVHTYNQRGTNDQLGDHGGTIKANSGFVEVFNTQDPDELGRAFGNWKLARLRHKGEFWVNVGEGGDGDVVQLKGPYLQEVDPAREQLHDGETVSTVAWARRDLVREEPLDAAERAAVGDAYVRRHRTAAAQVAYLTGEPPTPTLTEEDRAYEEAKAALAAALGPVHPARAAAPASAAPGLRERVLAVLRDTPHASVSEVAAVVATTGPPVAAVAVAATLSELFNEEVRT